METKKHIKSIDNTYAGTRLAAYFAIFRSFLHLILTFGSVKTRDSRCRITPIDRDISAFRGVCLL